MSLIEFFCAFNEVLNEHVCFHQVEELTRNFEEVQSQKDNLMAECAYYKVTLQETVSIIGKF